MDAAIPAADLAARWQALTGCERADGVPQATWLLLPAWLHEAWGGAEVPLADILWGQYALFSFIRIQDDLLDGHQRDLEAQFLADRFLVESLEAFQRLPLGDPFWTEYRRRLRDTVTGILELRRLESVPGMATVEHLPLHARVSAIFGVAVTAWCELCGRSSELPWLAALLDHNAIFSQICDDLQDVESDLAQQRYTWVANVLGTGTPGRGLMQPARTDVIVAELRRHADAALAVLPAAAPPRVREFAAALIEKADRLETMLHETRVRTVFGEVLAGAGLK